MVSSKMLKNVSSGNKIFIVVITQLLLEWYLIYYFTVYICNNLVTIVLEMKILEGPTLVVDAYKLNFLNNVSIVSAGTLC